MPNCVAYSIDPARLILQCVISCFKKIFDVSCTDTAVEFMRMFDCCEVSDVIGRRKLKFLQRYARSDSIVCLACNEYLVRDLSLSGRVCGSLSV